MQLRPLVLLTLFGFLVACSSEAPKPSTPQPQPAQEKKVPGIEDLGPLPAYQREINGSLTNVPAGAEVEMALLVIDDRSRPQQLLASSVLSGNGKPLAFPEWGLAIRSDGHGLGDDPFFINQMAAWMQNPANDVLYETYFDDNSGGVNSLITGGAFPNSLAAFFADFG